jgi:hypothetical protein
VVGGLAGGGQEEAFIKHSRYLLEIRRVPMTDRVLRDRPQDVVDRRAVTQLGCEERLEPKQVPQPVREAARPIGSQLAERQRDGLSRFLPGNLLGRRKRERRRGR